MNKFEKAALQCAKQDFRNFSELKKCFSLKKLKRSYVVGWKNKKWPMEKIKDFKKWNARGLM